MRALDLGCAGGGDPHRHVAAVRRGAAGTARSRAAGDRPGRHLVRARRGARRRRCAGRRSPTSKPGCARTTASGPGRKKNSGSTSTAAPIAVRADRAQRCEPAPRTGAREHPCHRQQRDRRGARARRGGWQRSRAIRYSEAARHLPSARKLGPRPCRDRRRAALIAERADRVDRACCFTPTRPPLLMSAGCCWAASGVDAPPAAQSWRDDRGAARAPIACSAIQAASRRNARRLACRCWCCASAPSGPRRSPAAT